MANTMILPAPAPVDFSDPFSIVKLLSLREAAEERKQRARIHQEELGFKRQSLAETMRQFDQSLALSNRQLTQRQKESRRTHRRGMEFAESQEKAVGVSQGRLDLERTKYEDMKELNRDLAKARAAGDQAQADLIREKVNALKHMGTGAYAELLRSENAYNQLRGQNLMLEAAIKAGQAMWDVKEAGLKNQAAEARNQAGLLMDVVGTMNSPGAAALLPQFQRALSEGNWMGASDIMVDMATQARLDRIQSEADKRVGLPPNQLELVFPNIDKDSMSRYRTNWARTIGMGGHPPEIREVKIPESKKNFVRGWYDKMGQAIGGDVKRIAMDEARAKELGLSTEWKNSLGVTTEEPTGGTTTTKQNIKKGVKNAKTNESAPPSKPAEPTKQPSYSVHPQAIPAHIIATLTPSEQKQVASGDLIVVVEGGNYVLKKPQE